MYDALGNAIGNYTKFAPSGGFSNGGSVGWSGFWAGTGDPVFAPYTYFIRVFVTGCGSSAGPVPATFTNHCETWWWGIMHTDCTRLKEEIDK